MEMRLIDRNRMVMHQSIPAAPALPLDNCGAFARLVSPGGGALANSEHPGCLENPNSEYSRIANSTNCGEQLTIKLRARVFYEQIVNEAQPS